MVFLCCVEQFATTESHVTQENAPEAKKTTQMETALGAQRGAELYTAEDLEKVAITIHSPILPELQLVLLNLILRYLRAQVLATWHSRVYG